MTERLPSPRRPNARQRDSTYQTGQRCSDKRDHLYPLTELFSPFWDMPIYRNISSYIADLVAVIDQLHRVVKAKASVVFVVANNVIGGEVFPVSAVIEELMKRSGFSSVEVTRRTIKNTRRRYPFGVKGFAGPMKDEYLITGSK